jgi:hypothetical protein
MFGRPGGPLFIRPRIPMEKKVAHLVEHRNKVTEGIKQLLYQHIGRALHAQAQGIRSHAYRQYMFRVLYHGFYHALRHLPAADAAPNQGPDGVMSQGNNGEDSGGERRRVTRRSSSTEAVRGTP